jgi:hypothetical protein
MQLSVGWVLIIWLFVTTQHYSLTSAVYKVYLYNIFPLNNLLLITSYYFQIVLEDVWVRAFLVGEMMVPWYLYALYLICYFLPFLSICFIYLNLYSNLQRLVRDLYVMLDEVNSEEAPLNLKVPETFDEFIWDMKNNDYDLRSFAFKLKATVS